VGDLNDDGVRGALRAAATAVEANVGDPLRWLSHGELVGWWTAEAAAHLLDPGEPAWFLDALPGQRGWLASEWKASDGAPILVFEAVH
jgi:hypothetical protein